MRKEILFNIPILMIPRLQAMANRQPKGISLWIEWEQQMILLGEECEEGEESMKRFILAILVLVILFLLFGCGGMQKDLTTEDALSGDILTEQAPVKEEEKKDQASSAYFFSEGLLLGSFEKNGWHSLCDTSGNYETGVGNAADFYAQDLLAVPEYHVFKDQTLLGDAKSIIWQTEEDFGLGSFETEGTKDKFAKYGELYHFEGNSYASHRIFSLPTNLGAMNLPALKSRNILSGPISLLETIGTMSKTPVLWLPIAVLSDFLLILGRTLPQQPKQRRH
jgi:hypothetical protein